jgi:uncharacterized membrane protein YadS
MNQETQTSIPEAQARSSSPLLRTEDWLAVWLGFLIIALVLLGVQPVQPRFAWSTTGELRGVFSLQNLGNSLLIAGSYLVLSSVGIALMGGKLLKYAAGFGGVYALSWLAQVIASNSTVKYWGLEYVIFALALGLCISNTMGVPDWLREAVRTEYYIKTGLVILGAVTLFPEIVQAGKLGVIQALVVVVAVWYVCFWIARKLRVDDEFAVMLSTAVSICGVSAAIAACGAIQGDRKKLSYVTSLVLIVAVPMMVVMPWVVKASGMSDAVAGAWIGGTLDTSGSVVAACEQVSDQARKTGVIVKLSQNVLIGVAAFVLSIWWTYRKGQTGLRQSAGVIWERFPKFVLGFLAASLVCSFLVSDLAVRKKANLEFFRNAWFALAFTSIGLETRFADLFKEGKGRPAAAFLIAQAFNVVWTLLIAYLLFGVIGAAPAR